MHRPRSIFAAAKHAASAHVCVTWARHACATWHQRRHLLSVYAQVACFRLLLPCLALEVLRMGLVGRTGGWEVVLAPCVTAVYWVVLCHAYLNVCVVDLLLRLHMPALDKGGAGGNSIASQHNSDGTCAGCHRPKPFHRLEDAVAAGVHNAVGSALFVWVPLTVARPLVALCIMLPWRQHQHAQLVFALAGACPATAVTACAPASALVSGALHAACELALINMGAPLSIQLTVAVLLAAGLDAMHSSDAVAAAAVPSHAPSTPVWHKVHIWLVWRLCRDAVVGEATLTKRRKRRTVLIARLHAAYAWLACSTPAQLARQLLLWPELRSMAAAARHGPAAAYTRVYLVDTYQALRSLRQTLVTYRVPLSALHRFVGAPVVGKFVRVLLLRDAKTAASVMAKVGSADEVRCFLDVLLADIGDALDAGWCTSDDGNTTACVTGDAARQQHYFQVDTPPQPQPSPSPQPPPPLPVTPPVLVLPPPTSPSHCLLGQEMVATIRHRHGQQHQPGANSSSFSSSPSAAENTTTITTTPAAAVVVHDDYFSAFG